MGLDNQQIQFTMSGAVTTTPIVLWSDHSEGNVYLERKNTFLSFYTDEIKALKHNAYPRSASADSHFKSSGRSRESTRSPTNRSSSPSDRSMWSGDGDVHQRPECNSPARNNSWDADCDVAASPAYPMTPKMMPTLPWVNESQNEMQPQVMSPSSMKRETAGQAKSGKKQNLKKFYKGGVVTTLMIRGIPCSYSQEALMSRIDDAGLKGKYNFFYLPHDGNRNSNLGYAFVNFVEPQSAEVCTAAFQGIPLAPGRSQKTCTVSAADIQGLHGLWKHFRKTAVSRGANGPMFLKV